MGKRELVIITTFVVIGVVAYQLGAEPPAGGRRQFSLATLMDHLREETRGRRSSATVATDGTIPLPRAITEVRISSVPKVTVRGEDRADLAYTLTVEASGADEQTARQNASRATLSQDAIGSVLGLRATAPRDGWPIVSLTLTVPTAIVVRVESTQGGASLEASGLQSLQLDTAGDALLHDITGSIAGAHRNGRLSIADSGRVDLTLQSSEAVLERTRGAVRLSTRNGSGRIVGATAPVELLMQNDEITIVRPAASVRVTGSGGAVTIDEPYDEVHVDTRRMAVDVRLAESVPLTILTTDEQLRLSLSGRPSFVLDAIATDGGTIVSDALGIAPQTIDGESRLHHTVSTGSVPVALRNRRGRIVIDEAK